MKIKSESPRIPFFIMLGSVLREAGFHAPGSDRKILKMLRF